MSAQVLNYEIPFQKIVDKNEKGLPPNKNAAVSSNSGNVHNPMYGVVDNLPSQEDGMYSRLNAQPAVNAYSNAKMTVMSENRTGDKKRLVYILFFVIIIMVIIAAFICLSVAFIKISALNSELSALNSELQQSLSVIMAETASHALILNTFNQTHTDIWQEISVWSNLTSQSFGKIFNPAASCAAVLALDPSSPSGYYWIRSSNGFLVCVYCDMTRSCGNITGGWMRVTELDMTNNGSQCPSGLTERTDSNIRTCHNASTRGSCFSVSFSTSIMYSQVCGRIQGYQYGSTDAFTGYHSNQDINSPYVDGISLTHGNPKQHIWTFAAALDEVGSNPSSNCPCTNLNQANRATTPPAFVGNDYFCDTGNQSRFKTGTFYGKDPLWDGAGCGPDNTCCSFNNPPWFYKQLPVPTTDDIEMRVCRDQGHNDENIFIESYDIYVH